ncbi:GD13867 [Drosophila simulans]|uniref:GD13867 n=1 Tax=Drosophila simulans TaxID=7240 RepID=B4QR37_DROSI|nr:GD13867 [Drosophila simulans]
MKFFVIAFAVIAAASAASIATDYLPPVDNNLESASDLVEVPAEQGVLSDDGYRYKTVRRLKLRHRRDVNELPSGEYLPPVEESASESFGVETPLADDGYRYKTVRRVIRRRRDVNELSAEYLPPVEESASDSIAVETPLADDGDRYKTVRLFEGVEESASDAFAV